MASQHHCSAGGGWGKWFFFADFRGDRFLGVWLFQKKLFKGMALRKEVSRSLYIKNLPYKIESEDLYTIFGKYGSIRQIRLGNQHNTRGTAFVVYDDIFDAKNAQESLSGFNVGGRYLVCLYFSEDRGKR